jgi:type I restriction enzyme S subunit
LDNKIELLREQNKTLEATAQAIFKEWFLNFNFSATTGKMIDSELGQIPEGWRVGKIKDFGEIICGKTPSKEKQDFFGGKIPFIKIPDMHGQVFINKTEDWLTEDGANTQKNKYIPANSICVSCIATVGLVSITSEKSQTNQQINSIIPKTDIYLEYLFLSLKNIKEDLLAIGTGGSTTLNINTTTFSNIEMLFPENYILENFHKATLPIFQKLNTNNSQIQTLSVLRDTLLPKLMKGEVRVEGFNN